MSDNPRNYSCKDEEIAVIGGFLLTSLRRDLADFTALFPKFADPFAENFETANKAIYELVKPAEETAQLKVITIRLQKSLQALRPALNQLDNYLDSADGSIPLSVADFGISPLRQAISKGDVEGALTCLGTLNRNIERYQAELGVEGLTEATTDLLKNAVALLQADNNLQYEIKSGRLRLVEENLELLNAHYKTMRRIMKSGKAIYKESSPARLADYTFSRLLKEVRRQAKQANEEAAAAE